MQSLINGFHNLEFFEMCSKIDDNSIDMILCDLPYGTTACKWDTIIQFDKMWEQFKRISKAKSAIVLTATQPFTSVLTISNLSMFKYAWVWTKSRKTDFIRAKLKPMGSHEDVLVFSKSSVANGAKEMMNYYPQGLTKVNKIVKNGFNVGGSGLQGQSFLGRNPSNFGANNVLLKESYLQEYEGYPNTVLNFASETKTIHPTQKPVALFEYLIKTYTCENDLVFDPCCGSGTTGIAAHNTNRRFICSDNGYSDKHQKTWVQISQERLEGIKK